MKLFLYLILLGLTFYNVFLGSALVRSGEVNFFNDVARDFLLFQELDEKKIVFIGARSNTNNLFHGPLWSYINYPSFVLGQGNPVTVAWFWIFLGLIFLLTSFFMVKKLFGTFVAFSYVLLISTKMIPHLNGIFHAEATFFFVPMFLFTISQYIKSKKNLYLALHLLSVAILIQLEVGVGIQFFLLSALLIILFIFKNKLWKHIFTFSLMPVFLLNFILFDLRHGLLMAKALISTGKETHFFVTFRSWIENRINNTVSLQLIQNENNLFIFAIFALIIFLTILQIKNKNKGWQTYFLFFLLFWLYDYQFFQ